MVRRIAWSCAFLACVAAGLRAEETPAPAAAPDFFFKPHDRVMFLGDSITEQYQYSTDIELYLTTRFPTWELSFLNAGISGDTAHGGANRFAGHVVAEKPTALTIDFGMNDGGYGGFNKGNADHYARQTAVMLDVARKAGIRVAVISPNCVDWRPRPNLTTYRETQKEFYAPLKDLADKHHARFVDQYAVTRKVLEKLEAEKATAVQPFPDGVHTSSQGGLLMAHTILVGLGAPASVSEVEIDVAGGAKTTTGCTVDKVMAGKDAVSFTRLDAALPVPVQADWLPLMPYVNNLDDFNHYGLKVTGLSPGAYKLAVDGKEVASYTADQLAKGVNLGLLTAGPIHDQAQKVFHAINEKNGIVHGRFRGVIMFQPPDWFGDLAPSVAQKREQVMADRLKQIAAKQAEIYRLAAPVPHEFALKRGS